MTHLRVRSGDGIDMKLVILDGNSVVNRAFYGVRLLTNSKGQFTNAIFGFINILQKVEHEEKPDAVCVAFDLKGPTFRHLQYDGYKATRHGMPEELAQQMPVLKNVLEAMNIPMFSCEGWEADDVIGTVGRICKETDWDCVIVTGDRDSLQLVDDHVTVKLVVTKGGQTTATAYTPQVFREEYGFEPPIMVDLKSLMGDSSDNIPGVAGVGPKTATDLLLKFGTMEGVYANLEDSSIRPKLREKLEAGRENAILSYDLATIRRNAPIVFSPEQCLVAEPDKERLYQIFTELEFTKLIEKYGLRPAEPKVRAQKEQKKLCRGCCLPPADSFCAVAIGEDGTVAVAWEGGICTVAPLERTAELDRLLESDSPKICHDLKTTLHLLDDLQVSGGNFIFDTALGAYDLNPSQSEYSVSRLARQYLSRECNSVEDEAEVIWQLFPLMQEELKQQGMEKLYEEIELPLCRVLYSMEKQGVAIDKAALEEFGAMLSQSIAQTETQIYAYAGGEFNILSPRQLGEILFEKLQLPPVKKTKTGYSTNAEVLEKLKKHHPIVPLILDYRMLTKLKSTYADGLLKVICPDGRIRTTFQNMVTATGRLSSTEPNLQNIPVRTELGSEIRRMFVPREGWVFVDADYSQIELRVLAHIAEDPLMQESFRAGQDIHTTTASQVFGVPSEEVTPLQRRHAKAVNFGIVYGISEFSLSEDIGVSRWAAKAYIDSYLDRYSGVKKYMRDIVETAKNQGFVTTTYGRRRYIPEIKSSNYNIRQGAERVALNTPIQGTAADIIKLAMIRVYNALEEKGLRAKLILQVHDELIVECPPEEADEVKKIVTWEMEKVAELTVPLVAEAKTGKTWLDAK